MLKVERQNTHARTLPTVGEIGYVVTRCGRFGDAEYATGRKMRVMVESAPLFDGAILPRSTRPVSLGIHTVNVRVLGTGELRRVAGNLFVPADGERVDDTRWMRAR